jgi:hypothetical protein
VQAQEKAGPPPESRKDSPPKKPTEDETLPWYHGAYLAADPEYEAGVYGTKFRSEFVYLPLTLGYDGDRVAAYVTVPYVISKNHGNVVYVGGRPVRVSKNAKSSVKTESGLGDVLVDAGYYVAKQDREKSLPSLFLEGELKFPTADDERGLGTGSYDETLRATAELTVAKELLLLLGVGYGFIGQPEDFSSPKFHDTIYWSAGVGWALNADNEIWLRADGNSPIVYGTPPYSLIYAEFDHWFKNESKVYFSLGFGTTTATPGLSITIGYKYVF